MRKEIFLFWEGFKIGWTLLTTIPLFNSFSNEEGVYGKAAATYPLTGLLLGAIIYILSFPISSLLPHPIDKITLFVLYIYLYGGLHLDGFSDITDALRSYQPKEKAIEIMKDPAIGAMGAIFTFLHIFLKGALFTTISPFVFIAIPMLSRYTVLLSIRFFPYLSSGSMGKKQHSELQTSDILVATILLIPLTFILKLSFIPLIITLLLVTFYNGQKIEKRLGALNGDAYGYIIELSELFLMLVYVGVHHFE